MSIQIGDEVTISVPHRSDVSGTVVEVHPLSGVFVVVAPNVVLNFESNRVVKKETDEAKNNKKFLYVVFRENDSSRYGDFRFFRELSSAREYAKRVAEKSSGNKVYLCKAAEYFLTRGVERINLED